MASLEPIRFEKKAEESGTCEDDSTSHVPTRYECPICLNCLNEPVLTSCGHKFCSACINNWFQKVKPCCPVDYHPLNPETDLFRDLFTTREISEQMSRCPYKKFGCPVRLPILDLDNHVISCQYRTSLAKIYCTYKPIGCNQIFDNFAEMEEHVEHSTNFHLMMLVNRNPSNTNDYVESKAFESTLWDAPSKSETTYDDKHAMLKCLFEKIVKMEQENHELRNELRTLRNSHGCLLWRLKPARKMLHDLNEGVSQFIYSPPFYSQPNGYKFCARLNISRDNREWLTLVLHTFQSDNDDALDWPFQGKITFTLVNPFDSRKNISESAITGPELKAFRKPQERMNNPGYGFTEFVRIDQISDYLFKDDIIIRVEVKHVPVE